METKKTTLRGLATVSFFADNLQEAKKWYTEFLGIDPYYIFPDKENPAYIEFRIGDFEHELGIIDKKYHPKLASDKIGGTVVFWHVDDIKKTFEKLVKMGAMEYEKITEREDGLSPLQLLTPLATFWVLCTIHTI